MTVVILTPEIVFRLTPHALLYQEAPFLNPMQASALSVHKALSRKHCSSCAARSAQRMARQMGGAFTRLVLNEYNAGGAGLPKLKAVMEKLLNLKIAEVQLAYQDSNNQGATIRF